MTPETQAFGQQMGLVAPKVAFTPAPPAPVAAAPAPTSAPMAAPIAPQQPAPVSSPSAPGPTGGLDPVAHTLANAIALQENGGKTPNYTQASADDGSTPDGSSGKVGGGAYQFTAPTWANYAQQFLGNPHAPMTPENQNQVAYTFVKQQLDAGHSPAQVASMWNAGIGEPNAYTGTFSNGKSSAQGNYNVPQYANNVQKYAEQLYQALPQNSGQNPQQQIQAAPNQLAQPSTPSFFGNLGNDIQQRAANLATNDANYAAGNVGVASHVLQDAGQVAGGFGDVFGEALGALDRTFTGGAVGGALGTGVHALASTAPGQAVAKAITDFSTAHPEAAKNIEAIANIASLFPVGKVGSIGVKGLEEVGAKLGATEAAQSLGSRAADTVASNLEDIFTNSSKSTVRDTFEHMLDRGQDPAQVLVDRKLATQIPIEDGHVRIPDNSPVVTALDNEIASKSELLTSALSKVRTTIPADDMKTEVNNIISQNRTFRQQGRIPEMQARAGQIIENYVQQEGKSRFKLTDIQGMKQGQTALSSMFRKAQDFGKADEHSALGFAFQKMIEDHAPDVAVRQLNKQTGELIATKELLGKLDGATIRGGRLGRYGARILGATIGSQGSIPIVSPVLGAFMGDAIVSGLQKAKIAGPINRLLMRVAQVAPDNSVVKDTQAFIQAVESGEKVMPSDDVAEFLARASAKADIPLLPPAAHDALRSVVNSGPTIPLPEKSLSTLDAEHLANPNIKTPQRLDGLSSTIDTTTTANTIDKSVNIPESVPPTEKPASELSPSKKKPADSSNIANGDAQSQSAKTASEQGGVPSRITASKPSTDVNTSTGNAPIGRGDVSAQKADTSGPFAGSSPSIPKELEPLAAEAKKYKSADEFVKAQHPLYHGTNADFEKFNPGQNKEDFGTWFSADKGDVAQANYKNLHERYVKPGTKLISESKLNDWMEGGFMSDAAYPHDLQAEGYRGVDYGGGTVQLWHPNEDTLTKQEMKDFYKRVKGTK